MTAISRMSAAEQLGAAIMRARQYLSPEVGGKITGVRDARSPRDYRGDLDAVGGGTLFRSE